MANNNFMKTTLSLTSPICMDINDNVVRPFDSFNKKNAPFIGDQLSPFYVEEDKDCGSTVFTRNGDKYQLKDKFLYKNGEVVPGLEQGDFYITIKRKQQTLFYSSKVPSFYNCSLIRQVEYVKNSSGLLEPSYRYTFIKGLNKYDLHQFTGDVSINSTGTVITDNSFVSSDGYTRWGFILIADLDRFKTSLRVLKVSIDSTNQVKINQVENLGVTFSEDVDIYNPYLSWVKIDTNNYGISIIHTQGTKLNKRILPFNFIFKNKEFSDYDTTTRVGTADKYYSFPFYFDYAIQGPRLTKVPAIYYVGKYDDIKGSSGVENENVFYFGKSIINGVSRDSYGGLVSTNWRIWFEDTTIKNNSTDIRKKVAVSYTLYPNYYHQCGCIKRKEGNEDVFIPWNFKKSYDLLEKENLFNGANISTPEINENTLVFNDVPDVIQYQVPNNQETESLYVNINNGYESGVSTARGNLLIPWNSFTSDVYVSEEIGSIFCHNEDGTEIEITKNFYENRSSKIMLYNDRYILLQRDSIYNAYDTVKNKWFKWSSGYNGGLELITGWLGTDRKPTQEELVANGKKANQVFLIASAENANYEVSGNPFVSSIFPASRLIGVIPNTAIIPYVIDYPIGGYNEVDIYESYGGLVPYYKTSYKLLNTFVKSNLLGLVYPESQNIILSLSLQADFIKSYNNHDFIIEDGKSYPLIYSNNYPIFAYRALTFIENITNVFVIQNSNYLIFDNKIMAVAYQGDQIVSNAIVADITGMEFIGNTNQVAFFFSKVAKKIYVFTGDTVLREQRGANVIDKIYKTFFIPADNTVVMSCMEHDGKDYVYFFGSDSFLRIENKELKECYYIDNQIVLISTDDVANKYSYFKNPNGKKIPIELQTGYFGIGNEMSSVIDCWYIRVFDEDKGSGDVTISQNTLTNIGAKTESKTIHINPGDWDKQTNSYLIRYQPRYQNGVGIQLNLVSDFSIYEIVVSSRQGETQLTSPKAQI